jgi:hypothetical protein
MRGEIMKKVIARQPYTGYAPLDDELEKVRRACERDGRIRWVAGGRATLRTPKNPANCIVMGAEEWAAYTSTGVRLPKVYR